VRIIKSNIIILQDVTSLKEAIKLLVKCKTKTTTVCVEKGMQKKQHVSIIRWIWI